MNLGQIVELAPADELFASPRHPYSRALLSAIPVPNPNARRERIILQGELPSPLSPPRGCRFHTRCPFAIERCRIEQPQLKFDTKGHAAACHRVDELAPAEPIQGSRFSPSLERLMGAFTRNVDVRADSGVDMIEPK
jgi:peptide/nickel transport system ATP-binding protein/oligopeptide transport system ATP-binding protein